MLTMKDIENLKYATCDEHSLMHYCVTGLECCKLKELLSQIERMQMALKLTISQIEYVGCQQHCDNGTIRLGDDLPIQCQWCAELEIAKAALIPEE